MNCHGYSQMTSLLLTYHCCICWQVFPLPMKYINLLKCPDCFRSARNFVADEVNLQLLADAVVFIIGAVLHNNTLPAYQCISFSLHHIELRCQSGRNHRDNQYTA